MGLNTNNEVSCLEDKSLSKFKFSRRRGDSDQEIKVAEPLEEMEMGGLTLLKLNWSLVV